MTEQSTVDAADVPSAVDSIRDAANVVSGIEGGGRIRFRLSIGALLEFKSVPPIAIREAALSIRPPSVPTVFMEDKGREEENPNDPDYIRAMQKYAFEQLYRVSDVLMLLGTSIVRPLPDDVIPPESDEWMEPLEAIGIPLPEKTRENKHIRYLSWLRLYAIRTEMEAGYIMGRITAMSGVTEVEVQRAAAAFRDRS